MDFPNRDVAGKHLFFTQLAFWDRVFGMEVNSVEPPLGKGFLTWNFLCILFSEILSLQKCLCFGHLKSKVTHFAGQHFYNSVWLLLIYYP
ncbi:MAG TPA: hypothetical protein DHM37_08380 [Candidatus Cloacimonas sp.]|nr:hypothetical protein [Candidatus Cloacimonas sp.]